MYPLFLLHSSPNSSGATIIGLSGPSLCGSDSGHAENNDGGHPRSDQSPFVHSATVRRSQPHSCSYVMPSTLHFSVSASVANLSDGHLGQPLPWPVRKLTDLLSICAFQFHGRTCITRPAVFELWNYRGSRIFLMT